MTAEPPPAHLLIRRRCELLAAGWSDRRIAAAVRCDELARVRRGAYVDGRSWRELDKTEQYAVLCRAVQRQACSDLVLSHVSALPSLGAPLWGMDLSIVHGTRVDGRAGRREAGVVQHRGLLLAHDVVEQHGVRFTTATKTLLDLTTLLSTEQALVVANDLAHRGLVDREELEVRYSASTSEGGMSQWPRSLTTRTVLALIDPAVESVGESRVAYLCHAQGLPRPRTQVRVRDQAGRVVARVDFAWPEHGLFLEFDGRVKYADDPDALWREKRREDLVRELTGWRCIRLTWADLADPGRTAYRIRAALGMTSLAG